LVAVLVPDLRPVFRTFPLDGHEWWLLLGLSAAIIPAMELYKLAQRAIAAAGASRA
jgi:Ca2+-transporting ATPase